jgi:uncharacterized protein (TIGR03067 family)
MTCATSTAYVLLGLIVLYPPGDDAKATAKFVGEWEIEAMRLGGVEQPPEACREKKLVFKEGELSLVFPKGGPDVRLGIAIADSKQPHQIDLIPAKGGKNFPAIYVFRDSRLILFIGSRGAARPTDIDAKGTKAEVRYVLKRIGN